ncbi:SRPBCC family protein [Alcanivorax sp. IL3]|jgi:uncharacterized protein YndB with AHSA1/START domain|nr:SRPBCC family protein [Alcanivorax sp.]MAC15129.1 MxaD family protein [Alcanivorax sp.]MBG32465.1 MxaD family protein [Alcanivorax sp.]|tara:strand:- start:930 stop:1349 length:420 start_codon:yes stop_codon:yes gene_type:complete
MQRIEITKTFPFSVDKLFDFLSDHENLEVIFAPAKIKRVKPGIDSPNGVGSTRRMRILIAPPFEETVTKVVPNELIEYKISKGSPLKNHKGTMRFSENGNGGSQLHYVIEFEGKLPLIGPAVKAGLGQAISRGLNKLKL